MNDTSSNRPGAPETHEKTRTRIRAAVPIAAVVVLAIIGIAAWLVHRASEPAAPAGRGGFDANRALPVVASAVRKGSIDVYINALGTVTPRNVVTVRSRVDGQLMKLAFREGQRVKAGELLAEIDPRPVG